MEPGIQNVINVSAKVIMLTTSLSELTQPLQNKSILPLDIEDTNNILSTLLMLGNSNSCNFTLYVLTTHRVSKIKPEVLNLDAFVNVSSLYVFHSNCRFYYYIY